jgi:hypothetical protein
MKITSIELGMLRVPLKTPFKTALRTVETVEDVVVLIRTDTGNTGYGEAPATAVITGDTHGSIIEAIRHFIAPRLIGQDVVNLNRLCGLVQTAMERTPAEKDLTIMVIAPDWSDPKWLPTWIPGFNRALKEAPGEFKENSVHLKRQLTFEQDVTDVKFKQNTLCWLLAPPILSIFSTSASSAVLISLGSLPFWISAILSLSAPTALRPAIARLSPSRRSICSLCCSARSRVLAGERGSFLTVTFWLTFLLSTVSVTV